MLRIEAGLLLLDVDFGSSRFAWTDEDRSTPIELGLGWMLRDLAVGRSGVHRPSGDRARAGRRHLALAADRPRPRLGGLRPDLQRGRADPAQGPHADPGGVVRVRRRDPAGRLQHELHVLADAPAPHRAGAGPARARRTRDARSGWRSTSTIATSTSGRGRPGCRSTTRRGRRPDMARTKTPAKARPPGPRSRAATATDADATTRSSSAAATTAWSTGPTWRRPGSRP